MLSRSKRGYRPFSKVSEIKGRVKGPGSLNPAQRINDTEVKYNFYADGEITWEQ